MDAGQALQELTEISSQVAAAVLVGADGSVQASTLPSDAAGAFADSARALLDAANESAGGNGVIDQLEASTAEGSLFVVREGERLLAATTAPDPTVGLVFYDLKSCLRQVAVTELAAPAKPKRRRKKENGGEAA